MNRQRYYLTTSIPYVNAPPHVGHALEFVQADALARFYRLSGGEVFLLTGTDENSLKNVQAAERRGVSTRALVDENAGRFLALARELAISYDGFIRTSESRHHHGARQFWSACTPQDIYKKSYTGLYCVGCEAFYTPQELEGGLCPEHRVPPERVEEENYFFRLSRYQRELEELIVSGRLRIIPESRKNEVLQFIRGGLADFSISRSRERAREWGVPVPGDDTQIMYVWFDALVNYLTGIGYGSNEEQFRTWWEESERIIHIIGKGITRFHAVYWPALLLSAGLRLPTDIYVHGYITTGGEKISKSLGNVIDPAALTGRYGTDAVRYFFLHDIPATEDADFSVEQIEKKYTGDLVHGIGNYAARVLAMLEKFAGAKVPAPGDAHTPDIASRGEWERYVKGYHEFVESFRLEKAFQLATHLVRTWGDAVIALDKPWELAKSDSPKLAHTLYHRAELLRQIAWLLAPALPAATRAIRTALHEPEEGGLARTVSWGLLVPDTPVHKGDILFPPLTP